MRWLRWLGSTPRFPDYGRVASWLLLGPALEPSGYARLAAEGVTHVLDLRSEASDDPAVMHALGLAWRRLPIDDRAAPTAEQLSEISAWLAEAGNGRPILYVHCEGGLGRSPTIAMALLMLRGFTRAEAHRMVLSVRSVASPTPEQDRWLSRLETEHSVSRDTPF